MGSIPTEVKRFFSSPRVVPCFPLLGLTPSGLFMGSSRTIIYTSELILCSTTCVPSATRHNIHMYQVYFCLCGKTSTRSANGNSVGGSQVCIMSQAVHPARALIPVSVGVFLLPPTPLWIGYQSITGSPPNINFASNYLMDNY